MATVTIPEGFAAVVVLLAKADSDDRVEIKFVNEDEGTEHFLVSDAIALLASNQADLIEDMAEEEEDSDSEKPSSE
jgi:hypothetical protein